MKRINIYLTDHEIVALQSLAQQTGLKFAELVRRLLDEGLLRQRRRHDDRAAPRPDDEL